MPRHPRILGNTGIYHAMIRGVNRMDIFLSDSDKIKFLETLARMKLEGEYILYGYCLMSNHVHLLIKEEKDPLHRTMKRIGISYSYYFNKKYKRVGHLFQDRFRSERIETENSLLACLRYIHNNPVKAYIADNLSDYEWSSYNIYTRNSDDKYEIVDMDFVLDIFSENKSQAIKRFKEFSVASSFEEFIEIEEMENNLELGTDPLEIIKNIVSKYNVKLDDLPSCKDKKIRTMIIAEMKEKTNLSARELSRITGLSKDMINRALQ